MPAMSPVKKRRCEEIMARCKEIDDRQEELELEAIQTNGGQFTPALRDEYDQLSGEHDRLAGEYRRLNGRDGSQQTSQRRTQAGPLGWSGSPPSQPGSRRQTGSTADRRSYAGLHGAANDDGGFSSAQEFFQTVASGLHDDRLMALSHGEYSDPHGGFAVPSQFASEILDTALEGEIVRPRARNIPLLHREMHIPRWDSYDHSTGELFGGLSASWTAEGQELPEVTGKLEKMTLHSSKLTVYTRASNELLSDSPGFAGELTSAIASTIGFKLDEAFLVTGTGVGNPASILADPALIEVAPEGAQESGTILYDNLVNMYARLHPASRNRSVWVASNSALPQLMRLSIVVGTGGQHIPLVSRGPDGLEMLTRPLILTEKLPELGSKGDIMIADFSQYTIGISQELRLDRSAHVGFRNDEVAFRAILRVDGRGSWRQPLQPLNGPTVSWCVTLGERS